MKIKRTFTVDAPPEHVWDILGPRYARAGDWASSVYVSSEHLGTPKVAGAPVSGRVCRTSLGPFTETIEAYDDSRDHVAYSAKGNRMPGFVKQLVNSWTVYPAGTNSRVEMELNTKIAFPFNVLMGPMMKMQFGKVLREASEELKHYAETGTPHPRNVKADASRKAVEARATLA